MAADKGLNAVIALTAIAGAIFIGIKIPDKADVAVGVLAAAVGGYYGNRQTEGKAG